MRTIKITKEDLNKENFYKKESIGRPLEHEDVNIEVDAGLGYVRFKKGLYVKGSIFCNADSGIKAGWGIEAGSCIKAGWGIEAGSGIEAGWGIKAGEGIKAGWGINAGEGIKAGWGIEAGWGIKAGLSIRCNLTLKWAYNLFAGTAVFRKAEGEDKEIVAGEFEGGEVAYGKKVVRKGKPPEMYWHIHHENLMEYATEPIKNRIEYIKENKPKGEIEIRLRLMKKVKAKREDYPDTHDVWEELHKKECGCGWDGKTIFTKENGFELDAAK